MNFTGNIKSQLFKESISGVLKYSEAGNYAGYSKFDALNSPLLWKIFGSSSIYRFIIIQMVNRIPFHIRPLLGVKKLRNPKGIANFIKAYCALYKIESLPEYLNKIRELSDWLLKNNSNKNNRYHGVCWGYNFPWQNPGFYAPRYFPNCIVTSFAGDALLYAYELTGDIKYMKTAESAATFILKDLPVMEETGDGKCIGYVPAKLRWKVININSVAAGFLSHLFAVSGEEKYIDEARRLTNWVISKKKEGDVWSYTYPESSSGIMPDNYHTGGILDGIFDYMVNSKDHTYMETYMRGLNFYKRRFFKSDGAPKLFDKKEFPYDIHSVAQGIITFVKAGKFDSDYMDFAKNIAAWGIRNMQDASGHFYYRKYKFYTLKYDLMRWNNSWMTWALAELLLQLFKGTNEK
ncbi:MAG: hypothetical protein ABIJ15_00930 [bacterium]